jgi:hypothetical protein
MITHTAVRAAYIYKTRTPRGEILFDISAGQKKSSRLRPDPTGRIKIGPSPANSLIIDKNPLFYDRLANARGSGRQRVTRWPRKSIISSMTVLMKALIDGLDGNCLSSVYSNNNSNDGTVPNHCNGEAYMIQIVHQICAHTSLSRILLF